MQWHQNVVEHHLLENEAVFCQLVTTDYSSYRCWPPDMLSQIWTEVEYHYDVCVAVSSAHLQYAVLMH
jgi:hypothetical protein